MTVNQALEHIYITPLNQKGVDVNVKDLNYIKHMIADIEDKDLVSTMLAMLSKVNFVSMLYYASNKSVEAKHIVSLLSKYFVESLVIEILNYHLTALSEPLIQTKQQSIQQPPQIISQTQPQTNQDIVKLIQLDADAYQKYTLAKQLKTLLSIQEAEIALNDLISLHDTLKHQYTLFPQTLYFKKPKMNLNYLKQLTQSFHVYTPTPVYHPKRIKKHKLLRFFSSEGDFNAMTILFGLLLIIPLGLLYFIPSWWIAWTVLMIVLFGGVGLSILLAITEEKEITLFPIFVILIALFTYFWIGPISLNVMSWQTLMSGLPTIGIWTIGILSSIFIWILLKVIYDDHESLWFWVTSIIVAGINVFFNYINWTLYSAIISSALVISSFFVFLIDSKSNKGLGFFGFIMTTLFGYLSYIYYLDAGFFK